MSVLHVLVVSKEAAVFSVRKYYLERSKDLRLGTVVHLRVGMLATSLNALLDKCNPGDRVLVSTLHVSRRQLEHASSFIGEYPKVEICFCCHSCFEHVQLWCVEHNVQFIANTHQKRTLSKSVGSVNTENEQDDTLVKEEMSERIWVQYRLILGTISHYLDLNPIIKQIILGKPSRGDSLKSEYARATRFFKLGEPSMAGGSYSSPRPQFDNVIDKICARLNKIAVTDFNVLVSGESGSGKEAIAWAIHELSNRRDKPFVAINCAGLPDELLESEMFGYMKGSHNQAVDDNQGILETVNGGTLFLDELPDMSLRIQAKLLRFIENGEFRPVGSIKNKYTDIRIIAAGQPERLMDSRCLRSDLKSRLSQLDVQLLPLRDLEKESPGTIAKISTALLERYTWMDVFNGTEKHVLTPFDIRIFQKKILEPENIAQISIQTWDNSNIRELNNFLRRWIVFGNSEMNRLKTSQGITHNSFSENKLYSEELCQILRIPETRDELKTLLAENPFHRIKEVYLKHLFALYKEIVEQENEVADMPRRATQKELAKLMGVTENTVGRHLNELKK